MRKIIYIIPGWQETTKQKRYKKVLKLFRKKGFKIVPVKITWKKKIMTDYVRQFLNEYKPKKNSYIFGFSFGAMVAIISAKKAKPKTLILCSISPHFKEDISITKKIFGKLLDKYTKKCDFDDLKKYSFPKVAKHIKCKTIILVGDKEGMYKRKNHSFVMDRAKEAHSKIKNSRLVIVKNGKHNIAQKEYHAALKKIIYKL